jgi:hypothetical protein
MMMVNELDSQAAEVSCSEAPLSFSETPVPVVQKRGRLSNHGAPG